MITKMGKRTANDPTGQAANRNRTTKRLAARLDRAMRKSIAEFRAIPRKRKQEKIISNESLTFYLYDMSASDLETLRISIQNHIAKELGTIPQTLPQDWWYSAEIELPIRQSTLEELIQINKQLSSAEVKGVVAPSGLMVQPIPPQRVLFSPRYLDAVREAEIFNYGLIKTMGDSTAQQVVTKIKQGTDAGLTPTQIVDDIVERFDVSKSNAKRIADTEINRAYNDAKLESAEIAKEESGMDVAVFHLSSLIATTRPNHAARHNNIYTPRQQAAWWDSGSERINCLCSVRTVILDSDGSIIDSALKRKLTDGRN